MQYSKPYYRAIKLQDKIMEAVDSLPSKELANLAKSFCALEVLKLRIRMKPAPKSVEVKLKPDRRKVAHVVDFTESNQSEAGPMVPRRAEQGAS